MDNRNNKYIIIFLIFSVIFNIYIYTRINNVERSIELTSKNNTYIQLKQQVDELGTDIAKLEEYNRWVVKEDFITNIEDSKPFNIYLDLAITFRELERDAKVYVEYTYDEIEWSRVEAKKNSKFEYIAPLNLVSNRIYRYRYIILGSVIIYTDSKIIPHYHYRPKSAYVVRTGKSEMDGLGITNFEVILKQEMNILNFFLIEKAYLEIDYIDGQKESIEFIDITTSDLRDYYLELNSNDSAMLYYVEKNFDKEVKNVGIRVLYKDGTIDEGYLWPWDTYHSNTI